MNNSKDDALVRKNARTGLMVLMIVAGMTGLAFASVPLYDLFCRVTGFGGTPLVSESLPGTIIDRNVTIRFNADTGRGMPWDFRPEMKEITVKMGQKGLTNFFAHNPQSKPVTGTAIYNVTPEKAGKYFHKIQCFCFGLQTLEAGQSVDMPVIFYVDPSMNDDRSMDDVKEISLSYTFYQADSKELDKAMDAFYNAP
jgi:cytochrome c oxidase assembly protein subunit 11